MRHNYDYIPQSILIFKNKQIIYANEHMKSLFLVDSYDLLSIKLRELLNIKSEDQLFDFLIKNDSFECNNRTINSKYVQKEYDLFLFDTLEEIVQHESTHPILKEIKTSEIEVISFFRGIKLQSSEKILKITDDSITLYLSKKQRLNLYDTREFFILVNNEFYSTRCKSYKIDEDTVELDTITPISEHTLDRNEVRLQVDTDAIHLPIIEKEVELFDISEKSISFSSEESFEEEELKKIESLNVPFIDVPISVSYFKTTHRNDKHHYIFLIEDTPQKLTEFIYERQREILKEFTHTLQKV